MITFENFKYTKSATFTRLKIDGELICYILQDTVRPHGIKVAGETGIPEGKGKLKIGQSPRFGRVPFLYNQDDGITYEAGGIKFTHLRVHSGNFIHQTDGCPLTGTSISFRDERTFNSRDALDKFMDLLEDGVEYDFEVINLPQEN